MSTSLGKFRVIGPLRNMPEFHAAFNIEPGDYMYLPEVQRAMIW
jgi:putative endopeptidase